jgi:general secretion pathway protein D
MNTKYFAHSILFLLFLLLFSGRPKAEDIQPNFDQAELKTVIETVANITGRNFIIDPRVKGKVSLIVPEGIAPDVLYTTFLTVLSVHGYSAIDAGEFIKIVPSDTARQNASLTVTHTSNWLTTVFTLRHAKPSQVAQTIQPLVSEFAAVSPLDDLNQIVITDTKDNLYRLSQLITKIDRDPHKLQTRVFYLSYLKASDLAPVLNDLISNSLGENKKQQSRSPNSIQFNDQTNTVLVKGDADFIDLVAGLIVQLDVKRAQVLIETIFVEINQDKATALGLDFGIKESGFSLFGNLTGLLTSLGSTAFDSMTKGGSLAVGSADDWGLFIKALNSSSATNLISTPTVLALDNEDAQIVSGREVPFQTGTYTNNTTTGTSIERKSIGLKLTVKPRVNRFDEIYLDVKQELSDILPKGEAVDIQTTKRFLTTQALVKNGNTVVLGGLISERQDGANSSVPYLSDIPLLGSAFKSTDSKREKVNLLIFIKPTLIKTPDALTVYSSKRYESVKAQQTQLIKDFPLNEDIVFGHSDDYDILGF